MTTERFDAGDLLAEFAADLGVVIPDADWADALMAKYEHEIEKAIATACAAGGVS